MSTIKVNGIRGVGASADAITVNNTDGTCTAKITTTYGNKNVLYNGEMNIHQRGTTTTSGSDAYMSCDRWKTNNGTGCQFTVSKDTDVPTGEGFGTSTKWDVTTADASPASGNWMRICQRLEGNDCQRFRKGTSNATKFAFQFWIKTTVTGTYIAELFDTDNNRQISKAYTVSSANTWEKKELIFDADTTGALTADNNISFEVILWLATGTDFSSGTLNTSWASNTNANRAVGQVNAVHNTANNIYLTGLQLEASDYCSDFEFLPYGVEEERCKRYFHRLVGGASDYWLQAAKYTNDTSIGIIHWSPWMRDIPTLSFNTGTNYHTFYSDSDESGANVSGSGWSIQQASKKSAGLRYLLTGSESGMSFAGSGDGIFWFSSSSATVDLNAEL